jgi:monoamine oxidase
VIEAADRMGGRAFSESATFGQPFDHGCAWLQVPANLPHLDLAPARGLGLVKAGRACEALYSGMRRATAAERRADERSRDRIEAAMEAAEGRDVAASTVIPAALPYSAALHSWIRPMDHGVDFADLSTADFNANAEL